MESALISNMAVVHRLFLLLFIIGGCDSTQSLLEVDESLSDGDGEFVCTDYTKQIEEPVPVGALENIKDVKIGSDFDMALDEVVKEYDIEYDIKYNHSDTCTSRYRSKDDRNNLVITHCGEEKIELLIFELEIVILSIWAEKGKINTIYQKHLDGTLIRFRDRDSDGVLDHKFVSQKKETISIPGCMAELFDKQIWLDDDKDGSFDRHVASIYNGSSCNPDDQNDFICSNDTYGERCVEGDTKCKNGYECIVEDRKVSCRNGSCFGECA